MFVVRSMEPMCPVIAIGQTPEEAWAACDAAGVARDRAIVERSQATSLGDAFAAADDAKQLWLELGFDASECALMAMEVRESRETIRELKEELATVDTEFIERMLGGFRDDVSAFVRRVEVAIETVKTAKSEAEA